MQRELQNTVQTNELQGKKVEFSLYDRGNNEVTSCGDNYTILWYDARMKNYIDLIKELPKKRLATNRVRAFLVVDKLGTSISHL